MTAPLNYATKAIASMSHHPFPGAPLSAAGTAYLLGKLRQAEVFVLPQHGELLDRSTARPEMPASLLKPPFPVVALEYSAEVKDWNHGHYDAAKCSRRIALAWDWTNDLPPDTWAPDVIPPGVVIASIAYYDRADMWLAVGAAMHLAYDAAWEAPSETPFRTAMLETGRMTAEVAQANAMRGTTIGILPEVIAAAVRMSGNPNIVMDALGADLMDEVNAYTDLCYILACRAAAIRRVPAAPALNRARIKAGKLPFKDYHVLEPIGGAA